MPRSWFGGCYRSWFYEVCLMFFGCYVECVVCAVCDVMFFVRGVLNLVACKRRDNIAERCAITGE